jgi:hypothetical protein
MINLDPFTGAKDSGQRPQLSHEVEWDVRESRFEGVSIGHDVCSMRIIRMR